MLFTARTVTAACAPWPLTVGKRTYLARPLSAVTVLALVPRMANDATRGEAVGAALRAAFPAPRWRWQPDAVRALRDVDPAIQARVVQQLFTIPGHATEAEENPLAALIAEHRALVQPVNKSNGPTLAIAALTCEVKLGAAWYYNPSRWATVDGYAPMAAVWAAYVGLSALAAQDRLAMASAMQLAQAHGPKVANEWRKLEAAAFPADPTMKGAA